LRSTVWRSSTARPATGPTRLCCCCTACRPRRECFANSSPRSPTAFHLVAPDYPGFGHSAFPPADKFEYSFAHLTGVVERFIEVVGLERFSIYIQDGFMPFWEPLFAYATDPSPDNEARIRPLLTPEANVWQWTHGTRDPQSVDPDLPALDTLGFDRPGNRDVQVGLLYDYRLNLDKYPAFQQYVRDFQPPMLITWGKNDDSRLPHAPHELSA
jgi:hypothetical protein